MLGNSLIRSRVRHLLPEKSFIGKLLVLTSGTVVGQALLLLSSPLLTRFFAPAEFGLFAVFAALAAIFGVIACLRLEFALPVILDEDEAAGMAMAAVVVAVAMSLSTGLLVWLAGPWFVTLVSAEVLLGWLWLLPLAVLVWGFGSILSYWSIRRGGYATNGFNRSFQLGSQAGGQVALGALGTGPPGLILGYLLGYGVRLGHFAARLAPADRRLLLGQPPAQLWRSVRRHWHYPAYSSSSSLLYSICDMAPAILIAALYGPVTAGLYALCQRVMGAPVKLLSETASQVFLGEARGLEGVALHRFFLRTITLFTALGIAGMLPVLLFAPPAFIVLFGEAWHEAGVLVQLLVPFFFSRFVVFPISQLVHVLKRQDVYLLSAVLNVLALGVSFGSGLLFTFDVQVTVLLFSLTVTLANLVTLAISWHLVASRATAQPATSTP